MPSIVFQQNTIREDEKRTTEVCAAVMNKRALEVTDLAWSTLQLYA